MNPYKLGFEIFSDVERMCKNPTEEDRYWFPDIVGQPHMDVIHNIIANYRDESFVRQFLSPRIVKKLKLFHLYDERTEPFYLVDDIQDDKGFESIRETLANGYEQDSYLPILEAVNVAPNDQRLTVRYYHNRGRRIDNAPTMIKHLRQLWSTSVAIEDKAGANIQTLI